MLESDTYIVKPVDSDLPIERVKSFLERSGTAKLSPFHDDIYLLSETSDLAERRLSVSRELGELVYGGIWLKVSSALISISLDCADGGDRLPLVRFLEWLEKQCEISITENGGYPQPELKEVGIRAFLPEELRDRV